MNVFANLVDQLRPDTLACLQAVCLRNHSLTEIEASARAGPMEPHLKRLADLGLVVFEDGSWLPTWSGRGVNNWRQQVLFAESFGDTDLPEPRAEENGDQVVPGCSEYRPLFCSPGYCWCGHLRSEHASEAPKTAAKMLTLKREDNRREALLTSPSGRSVLELHSQLDVDQLAALHVIHKGRADGVSATELGETLRPRLESSGRLLSYVAVHKLLERLAELDLVVADQAGKYWYPSFDGRGVANWDSQLRSFPAPHPEPRPGENGDSIADQPCDQYRALFNSPGYCWCGHFRTEHLDHG